jgi:hypothetical protein
LLSAGADPNETLTDPEAIGESLYHAVEFADTECARLLLEAGTAQHKISYCLGRALDFDREPMVELLLSYGAKHGRTSPRCWSSVEPSRSWFPRRTRSPTSTSSTTPCCSETPR